MLHIRQDIRQLIKIFEQLGFIINAKSQVRVRYVLSCARIESSLTKLPLYR